jgi:hypothetical protein
MTVVISTIPERPTSTFTFVHGLDNKSVTSIDRMAHCIVEEEGS